MQRTIAIWCAVACLLLVGCVPSSAESPQAVAPNAMGMGAAGDSAMVSGAIAAADDATITVGPRPSSRRGVAVASLRAPADGWLVVRSAAPEGPVLGTRRVDKGVSRDLVVKLTAADGAQARVALHVDRGAPGVFEFDPTTPQRSLDRPVVVDRNALEVPLRLDAFGSEVVPNTALVKVEDQPVRQGAITVDYLLLPRPSWISVTALEQGRPVRLLGAVARGAGELQQVTVPIEWGGQPADAIVMVHAEQGVAGRFEYRASDPLGSGDQPYKSAGVIVSKTVRLE